MSKSGLIEIPARRGKAVRLGKGRQLKLINTHGTQVVDTWAFNENNLHEFMSMEHTRPHIGRIYPRSATSCTPIIVGQFSPSWKIRLQEFMTRLLQRAI